MSRVIVHLDADAFFASVEQAADSRLRGKPVAVGGEKRGIIASASYEARKLGIHTPMPTARARMICPKLVILPGDFEKYERFSRWMFSYAYDFTPDVEQTSIDEGYFDLTAISRPPVVVAATVRAAIFQALKISVSEGISTNKLVSQIASKLHKPAAFTRVPSGRETGFLHPLPNRWLPGVGPKNAERLNAAGLARIGQIASTPIDLLELLMGRQAVVLRQFANGIDERPVIPASAPARSYGEQQTFEADQTDEEFIEAALRRMADSLMARVREDGKSIRTLTVKIRYNDMAEDQRGESLKEPTDLETDLYGRIHHLLRQAWKRRVSLRMASLKLSNVYDGVFGAELQLEEAGQRRDARRRLAVAVDQLRREKGHGIILRGHDLLLSGIKAEKPRQAGVSGVRVVAVRRPASTYVPLNIHSYYSFLDSTLSPEAIVRLAAENGLPAVALTDTGNLHGAVEFFTSARKAGIKPIIGAEVKIEGQPLWLYVQNIQGYGNLCRLLSMERKRIEGLTDGLIGVGLTEQFAGFFPGRYYLGATGAPGVEKKEAHPAVLLQPVHYARPADRWKYDVVQSIRTLTLLRQEHPEKRLEGDFHFRSPQGVSRWGRDHSELLRNTVRLAERCEFEMPLGRPQFPAFHTPDGSTSHEFLRRLVLDGLRRRYPGRYSELRGQIEEELAIIREVGYEEYFLVVWDILQECGRRGIEWITRGSAADSLVCYCLGISDVCPVRFDLYFRRFLNKDRMALNKLPDIDVDFPHDRKDDVVDLLFEKYGKERCAVVGGFSTYQARGAVGDVAKVLGLSEQQVRRFTGHLPWARARGIGQLVEESVECGDLPVEEEPYRTALRMAEFLDGFPRHPKMHPCGVVLSRQPIHELTPTFTSRKGYPAAHYDMDAVEALGLVKIDILAQGGLAVMRDVKESLAKKGISINLASLEPWDDPEVWKLIAGGDSRAVHHIESPAMISLCRMSNVRDIDTLIAIVSVIRPGASNEHKKVKFTRRCQGLEPITYPHPSLEPVLKGTFGLVVYEEHILQICEAFAGMPPGRADVLRRALGKGKMEVIREIAREFYAAAKRRGHSDKKIAEVWDLVAGFAGYAFCKAHSTAYGVEAYQAAWLKRRHPAQFMAAVLSNGKGFYDPLVYVLECHRLGIPLVPPSVNEPGPDFTVENNAIRVPVTRIKGMTDRTGELIVEERRKGPFASLKDFYLRVSPSAEETELMIRSGAFDEFGKSRTSQFWEAQFLNRAFHGLNEPGQGWLLPPPSLERLPETALLEPDRKDRLRWETELLGFPVSGHPLDLHDHIAWETYCPVSRLGQYPGQEVVACGMVIEQRLHHQVTGEPMKFLTLADKTGIVETELFADTYRSYGLATVRHPVLEVTATVEPFQNGRGFSLRVLRAEKPRTRAA